jgi:hypothetical protein
LLVTGADTLTGGAGNDSYPYLSAAHSTAGSQDHIVGFGNGADLVNLAGIDAISGGANDAFTFIGAATFTHVAGQLRAHSGATTWYAEGDIEGDGSADLSIAFDAPLHALTGADFVLQNSPALPASTPGPARPHFPRVRSECNI